MKTTLLTIAAAGLAAAAFSGPSAHGQAGRTFEVVSPFVGGKTTSINLGRKSLGPGDQFLTTGQPLLDGPKGARIGTQDSMEIIVGMAGDGTVSMSGTLRFKDGRVHYGGVLRHSDRPQSIPVTGGTGAYAGARGTVTATEDEKAKVVRLRVELSSSGA